MTNIKELVDGIVAATGRDKSDVLSWLLDDMSDERDRVIAAQPATAPRWTREAAPQLTDEQPRRRRRGPTVRRVVYHVVNRRNRGADLTPTPRRVYTWLLQQRGDVSAQDVEKGLKLRRKQVESALYSLRTTGHVQSIENGQ